MVHPSITTRDNKSCWLYGNVGRIKNIARLPTSVLVRCFESVSRWDMEMNGTTVRLSNCVVFTFSVNSIDISVVLMWNRSKVTGMLFASFYIGPFANIFEWLYCIPSNFARKHWFCVRIRLYNLDICVYRYSPCKHDFFILILSVWLKTTVPSSDWCLCIKNTSSSSIQVIRFHLNAF